MTLAGQILRALFARLALAHRLRAMRVFRDETGLAITPALWPSIEAVLLDSEYFLLLASPEASASEWVQREVACWLDRRSADHLLIALTRGEIRWNDAAHDFDWNGTDALPRQLSKAFDQVPKYVDLSWARMATDLSLRNPDFLTAVASVASTLQGQPLDELVGEDVRQHRRTRRVAAAAIVGLATLAVAAIVFGVIAGQQRDEHRAALDWLTARFSPLAMKGTPPISIFSGVEKKVILSWVEEGLVRGEEDKKVMRVNVDDLELKIQEMTGI